MTVTRPWCSPVWLPSLTFRRRSLTPLRHGDSHVPHDRHRPCSAATAVETAGLSSRALRAAGRPEEALRYADQVFALGTRNALTHYHRGMILFDLGRDADARAELETALRTNPHFSVVHAPAARAALKR